MSIMPLASLALFLGLCCTNANANAESVLLAIALLDERQQQTGNKSKHDRQ